MDNKETDALVDVTGFRGSSEQLMNALNETLRREPRQMQGAILRAAISEITTLRAQLTDALARIAAMESGDWSEVKLVRFADNVVELSAGPIPAIAEYLAQMMQDGEGKYFNYMEIEIGHRAAGPMVLSLQRKHGMTPNQLRKEAEARAAKAEAALAALI